MNASAPHGPEPWHRHPLAVDWQDKYPADAPEIRLGRYADLLREWQGVEAVPIDDWRANQRRAQLLRRQGEAISQRLAALGAAKAPDQQLYFYGALSGVLRALPAYVRSNTVPGYASARRKRDKLALEAFLEKHRFARMIISNDGPRVATADIRQTINDLTRAISKANPEMKRRFGYEVVYRVIELGEPKDANGEAFDQHLEGISNRKATWHVHAHLIVDGPFMPYKRFVDEYLPFVRSIAHGVGGGDSGVVRNANELTKYLTKPARVLGLPDCELLTLHDQLYKAKLCQPLGPLRRGLKQIKDSGRKLVRRRNGRVAAVPSWHVRRPRSARRKDYAEAALEAADVGRQISAPAPRPPADAAAVLAQLLPTPAVSPLFEPVAIVWATSAGRAALEGERWARHRRDVFLRSLFPDRYAPPALVFTPGKLLSGPEAKERPPNARERPPDCALWGLS